MQLHVSEISHTGPKRAGTVEHINSSNCLEADCSAAASTPPSPTHEFGFDLMLKAAIRIKAASPEQAKQLLFELFDAATCKTDALPNGEPFEFEASVSDRHQITLFSVDDVEVAG